MDCTGSALSICQARREKALAGIFLIAHKLLLSHFSFHFFLSPRRCRSHPGPRTAGLWFAWWIWVLMSWYSVKGTSGSATWVGVEVFPLEELEIFSVQKKGQGTNLWYKFPLFFPPAHHWAVVWSYRWTSFTVQQKKSFNRLGITQPDISQPKLWPG